MYEKKLVLVNQIQEISKDSPMSTVEVLSSWGRDFPHVGLVGFSVETLEALKSVLSFLAYWPTVATNVRN